MKRLFFIMILTFVAPFAWAQSPMDAALAVQAAADKDVATITATEEQAAAGVVAIPQVDLILPPQLASADAPFYRGASVKVNDDVLPVTEGKLPAGQLAEYQPENKTVVVSDSTTVSEIVKGQALLDVVTAMQLGEISTAAGQADTTQQAE